MHAYSVATPEGGLLLVIHMTNKYIVPLFNRLPLKGTATGILAEY
jgi:hypothetical protein